MDDMARLNMFANRLINFEKRVKLENTRAAKDMGKKLDEVKSGNYGLFGRLRSLTPAWVARKSGDQKLKSEGSYLEGITVSRLPLGFMLRIRKGLLAKWLEFGTKRMKPIPHWKFIRYYGIMLMKRTLFNSLYWLVK